MSKPTIMLFGASWCSNCKTIKPVLEMIGDVEYIDIDENIDLARSHDVRALPTYINKENGKRGTGPAQSVSALKETLGV